MSTTNDEAKPDLAVTQPTATPPRIVASDADTSQRRFVGFDRLLFVLMLILAFFLGSFTAHNTDLFLHLGLGSPFGAHADQSGWVHHAWLTSSLVSWFYEPFSTSSETGRQAVIVAKALLVVCLAVVLCLIRKPGQSLLVPITCTTLAIVVMSSRLLLQPAVVSLLFLAVTLWLLNLPPDQFPRAVWVLPVFFALWVNMDQWFVLGPLTVALVLLGTFVQMRMHAPSSAQGVAGWQRCKTLAMVFCVGLAACLLNPWLHRAFTLPMELAYLFRTTLPPGLVSAGRIVAKVQEGDPQFMVPLSPFSSEYLSGPGIGSHLAGLAYFALLIVGVASFVLPGFLAYPAPAGGAKSPGSGASFPLLAIFLVFAILSVFSVRLVPFFAVVAGPVTALNFQQGFSTRRNLPAGEPKSTVPWAFAGRGVMGALCVMLLAFAWPGWLHGNADDWRYTRHVAWDVEEDPGVPEAVKTIHQVQIHTGLCKLGFNYSMEGGNLFAWSRFRGEPDVKVICDGRYMLNSDQAEAYGKLRRALRDEAEIVLSGAKLLTEQQLSKLQLAHNTYRDTMRSAGIDYVAFTGLHYDSQARKIANCLLADPFRQWALLYHDGRTAVFGWLDSTSKTPNDKYRSVRLDLTRFAPTLNFPPNVPKLTLDPDRVATAPSDTSDAWHQYLRGPEKPALTAFQAGEYLALYKVAESKWQQNVMAMTGGLGVAGTAASGILAPANSPGPPAALILSVRAGRLATVESPNDVNGYLGLGQSYQALLAHEEIWIRQGTLFNSPYYKPDLRRQFRLAQTITALQNAVMVQPDNLQAHEMLHKLFLNMNFLDLALEHIAVVKKGVEAVKPASREQAEMNRQVLKNYEQLIKGLTEEIQRRRDSFELRTTGQQDILAKFDLALFDPDARDKQGRQQTAPRGLVGLALKMLLEAKIDGLADDAIKLHAFASWQLYLLLMTGQAREADDRLKDEKLRDLLPGGEYEQLRAMAAAALGDYAAADKFLQEAEKARGLPPDRQIADDQNKATQKLTEHLAATAARGPGYAGLTGVLSSHALYHLRQSEILETMMRGAKDRRDVAEFRLVRGLLALEAGQTFAGAADLRGSLEILPQILPVALPFTDRPIARHYLELLEAH